MDESTSVELTTPQSSELFDMSKMPPSGAEWLQEANSVYLTAIIIATLAVLAVIVMASFHLYYIHFYISNEHIQDSLYYLALLMPIMATSSLLAMYMPRCSMFLFTVCLTYLMMCLLMVISLMRHLFGSREAFCEYMQEENRQISISVPPLCCCCKCCPTISPTVDNLRHLEWMVQQSPIARITIEIVLIVAFLEHRGYESILMVGQILEAISMLTATWACQMLIAVSREKLKAYCFGAIFQFVNTTQVFVTLQKLIFDLIGKYHGFDNVTAIGPVIKAFFWNNFTITLEMCLMAALVTWLVNPKRSALFDLYGQRKYEVEKPPLNPRREDNNL